MEESSFAYSLSQAERGWSWRLWNEAGEVVAAGEAPDQESAHGRIVEAYRATVDSGEWRPAARQRRAAARGGRRTFRDAL